MNSHYLPVIRCSLHSWTLSYSFPFHCSDEPHFRADSTPERSWLFLSNGYSAFLPPCLMIHDHRTCTATSEPLPMAEFPLPEEVGVHIAAIISKFNSIKLRLLLPVMTTTITTPGGSPAGTFMSASLSWFLVPCSTLLEDSYLLLLIMAFILSSRFLSSLWSKRELTYSCRSLYLIIQSSP